MTAARTAGQVAFGRYDQMTFEVRVFPTAAAGSAPARKWSMVVGPPGPAMIATLSGGVAATTNGALASSRSAATSGDLPSDRLVTPMTFPPCCAVQRSLWRLGSALGPVKSCVTALSSDWKAVIAKGTATHSGRRC